MKEFTTAVEEAIKDAEGQPVEEQFVEFKVDDRILRAYQPTDGQLTFMLAALGRGQTSDRRFAAIVNIMMASLREEDQDYFETRLLSRDPQKALGVKTVESIFEFLMEEWFARPTQQQSDSAQSPPSDGQN